MSEYLYSFVIVDDEPEIREGIRDTIPWNQLGFAFKGAFSNGKEALEYVEQNPHTSLSDEIPEDLKDVEDYVKILLFKAEELYNSFDSNERLRELRDLIHKLTRKYQKEQKQDLTEAIRAAESTGDEALVAELLNQFNDLLRKE